MHDGAAVTVMVVPASLLSVWSVLWLGWVGFPKYYHTGLELGAFRHVDWLLSAFMLLSSCSSWGVCGVFFIDIFISGCLLLEEFDMFGLFLLRKCFFTFYLRLVCMVHVSTHLPVYQISSCYYSQFPYLDLS